MPRAMRGTGWWQQAIPTTVAILPFWQHTLPRMLSLGQQSGVHEQFNESSRCSLTLPRVLYHSVAL